PGVWQTFPRETQLRWCLWPGRLKRLRSIHSPATSVYLMESKKLAQLCREFADNKKGEEILVLDVKELSSVTDYFVLVSGSSEPHLRAISEEIIDRLDQDHG